LGSWKLACILCGVHARFVSGAMGDSDAEVSEMPELIDVLAERARADAAGLGVG
jgi:hypothetical protein